MRKALFLGAALALFGAAQLATAQTPPAPPPAAQAESPPGGPGAAPTPPGGPRFGGHHMGGPRGPGGPHGPWMRAGGPPPPPAASFRIERGDVKIGVRCAPNEPMQACVAAASALLDKVAGTPAR
ncbi:hypothetical protein LPC08_16475 [Roseomonas sp. OT10]|uniref:hypothetical protein n=1 Tax=Roseomonas cutis TaxID=2897332 RepID=UPI001E474920|nr:hypothetical protein [Roseomonas sp. OT10]UFN47602.1 hypothetical protein LPC08_16475 [Roseomonas sp. OT10]